MSRYFAIVPAAGTGARFGADVPKQFLELAGKPLIYHSIAALCRCIQTQKYAPLLCRENNDHVIPQLLLREMYRDTILIH